MSVKTVLYFGIAAHYIYGCYYYWNNIRVPPEIHSMGRRFGNMNNALKYLTFIDASIQAFFFTICFLNSVIGTDELRPKKKPFIRKLKDILFPSLAFPLGMFVGSTFWGMHAIDRELVFPAAIDPYFPCWLNHIVHTNVSIFIVMELFLSYRSYPSRKVGLSILTTFMALYLSWLLVIYTYGNIWVYPVLEKLNLPGRVAFFATMQFLATGLYILGETINNRYWRLQIVAEKRKVS